MNRRMETQKKIERTVVGGYKAIETGVVTGYQRIENGAVGAYKRVEKRFVDAFLTSAEATAGKAPPAGDGETPV